MTSTEVFCPWCEKGQVFVEGRGEVYVTVLCPKCHHCYKINLLTNSVVKVPAYRKPNNKSYKHK